MSGEFRSPEWITPNRMRFESGYRTFDKQVDIISPGNVISNVQHSSVIRAHSDTNGGFSEPGRCRQFDIEGMNRVRRMPSRIREWLLGHPEEKCWLYNLHFRNAPACPGESVCWILTDYGHTKSILSHCHRSSAKRWAVVEEALKYLLKRPAPAGERRGSEAA